MLECYMAFLLMITSSFVSDELKLFVAVICYILKITQPPSSMHGSICLLSVNNKCIFNRCSQFYLVLDIANMTSQELELKYGTNKSLLMEENESCRIPIPVERCPLAKIGKVHFSYIWSFYISWSVINCFYTVRVVLKVWPLTLLSCWKVLWDNHGATAVLRNSSSLK